jgi:hypothetical protein
MQNEETTPIASGSAAEPDIKHNADTATVSSSSGLIDDEDRKIAMEDWWDDDSVPQTTYLPPNGRELALEMLLDQDPAGSAHRLSRIVVCP